VQSRALLADPRILILDEATSAVDAQSEAEIHHVLKEFVRGRTAFVITHWITPRVLDFVTRIAVMEKGRLVATGSHDELMRTCPAYVSLYHAQQQREPAGRGGQGPDDASEPGTAAAA